MPIYRIETRPNGSTAEASWMAEGLGDNEFESRVQAEAGLKELRHLFSDRREPDPQFRVVALATDNEVAGFYAELASTGDLVAMATCKLAMGVDGETIAAARHAGAPWVDAFDRLVRRVGRLPAAGVDWARAWVGERIVAGVAPEPTCTSTQSSLTVEARRHVDGLWLRQYIATAESPAGTKYEIASGAGVVLVSRRGVGGTTITYALGARALIAALEAAEDAAAMATAAAALDLAALDLADAALGMKP